MAKVVAFVPIKFHSQRLPGKNFKLLNGHPLCRYLFDTLAEMHDIPERYVFCSDERIKQYMPNGLEFLQRDSWLDGEEVKGLEIIGSFVEKVDADIYMIIHATQPFIKVETVRRALGKVIDGEYDSAFSCVKLNDYFWYKGRPVNYDMKNIVTTQNVEPLYMETGAFFIFRREVFSKLHQRIGNHPYMCEVNSFEAIDIDTQGDFDFAEAAAEYLAKRELDV